jgi:excisionase family DNA binding protein
MTTDSRDDFIPIGEAARRMRVSRTLVLRRIRAGKIAAFHDPRDARKTLVRKADLDGLKDIRPAKTARVTVAAGSSDAT